MIYVVDWGEYIEDAQQIRYFLAGGEDSLSFKSFVQAVGKEYGGLDRFLLLAMRIDLEITFHSEWLHHYS